MNRELFASMREQMTPSREARAALAEKLAAPRKKRVPVGRYAAIAACAAVMIAAVPVYNLVQNQLRWRTVLDNFHPDLEPHSYVLADSAACWPAGNVATAENTADSGTGDENQDMTEGEVADNMLEAGFTQEDVDAYLESGWQMTWAKWWKFYHLTEENEGRSLDALLEFSREEGLAVNTGEALEMPGGVYIGETPDQSEAIMAYQNLMDRFKADYGPDKYPEWYGGAYIDENAGLIVNIAEDYEPEGKELFFQIQDWAGGSRVSFGSSPHSMNDLRSMQDRVLAVMDELGIAVGCGINEETGMVELTLPEVNEDALRQLGRLDPEGTAILVIVARTAATDSLAEEPSPVAPSVSHVIQPGGPSEVRDGAVVDEDGVIAWEPQG